MKDLLYFLKEFPDKWVLFLLCLIVGLMYYYFHNDFSSQLLNTVISALVGLLIGRTRSDAKETTINTEQVNTPAINNNEMNDAVINVVKDETPQPLRK